MLCYKRLGLACVAATLVARGVRAAPSEGTQISSAYCSVTAKSFATSDSQSAFIEAWEEVSEYVCSENGTTVDIYASANAIAYVTAEALAEVVAQCETQGTADARAQAYAFAQDRAEAIGEAIAGIWAGISTCDSCSAVVDSFVRTSKFMVAEAVAEAWTDIYVYSDAGAQASELSEVTSRIIIEKVADVIVEISGTMNAAVQDGCSISVINSINVGDLFSICNIEALASAYTIEVDAIAKAGADAAAWACDGDIAEAQVTLIAKATATAIAEAIGSADVFCQTQGEDTLACGMAQSSIEDVAYAQAEAFASAFAQAESCNCSVTAGAETSVWGAIWAGAAINAYADTCAQAGDYSFASDFQLALEERIIAVTAKAIAEAVATGGNQCRVSVDVCSSASSSCVPNNAKCYGSGMANVQPCCDDDYRCMKRNDMDYRCKHKSYRAPSWWDGEIVSCSAPSAA